jgi:hypothetical protein
MICICGHNEDEHGNDPEYPGSTACRAIVVYDSEDTEDEPCECVVFEDAGTESE